MLGQNEAGKGGCGDGAAVGEDRPLVTFAIPCYNSAEYMDRCIESNLDARIHDDDLEIVVVDDGSQRDDTPRKADEWAAAHPGIIKAVHQENGGHGAAVLTGLAHAAGLYYKVVDSDDWIDRDAARRLLADVRDLVSRGVSVDLFITNYVYEHVADDTRNAVGYRGTLPEGRVFGWDDVKSFRIDRNLLMHALMYRTDVLRAGGVPLPRHTFYVDNIYAYVPLPRCELLFYRDVDLYRYYIGREDQSVNERVMVGRYEQQLRITRIMMEAYHLFDDVKSPRLRAYMFNYFTLMMTISTLFGHMSSEEGSDEKVAALWDDLKAFDGRMYQKVRRHYLGVLANLPGEWGKRLSVALYRAVRKVVKFN